jgi:hypothetical protein
MGASGRAGAGDESAGVEPPRAITSRSPLEAALAYGAAGWPVLPVAGVSAGACGCRRPCESPGKHPLTRHGVHEAITDPVLIREWWRRSPEANVGIATGSSSGLVVVDLDLLRGGRESLGAVLDAGRDLPRTLRARTGGGGLHLFYAAPPNVRVANTAGRLPGVARPLPGIDLRGDGGYVVVPPSVHASGRRYRWDRRARVSALPAWLWPARPAPPARAALVATTWEGASAYGAAALSRQLERVRGLAVGERNDGLNRAAFSLGRLVGGGELGEALVHQALLCAALAIGLGQAEAEATIRSGLRAGRSLPRRAALRGAEPTRLREEGR